MMIFLLWWFALGVMIICLIPRPKCWAEQAGEAFMRWIDERTENDQRKG